MIMEEEGTIIKIELVHAQYSVLDILRFLSQPLLHHQLLVFSNPLVIVLNLIESLLIVECVSICV